MKTRCNIGVIIGNANSPHAMDIMAGINRAAEEMDVNLLYFVNVSSPYVAQVYPQEESAETDYHRNAIYEYAGHAKADVWIMTYGIMSIFLKGKERDSYLKYFQGTPCVLLDEQTQEPGWTSIISDNYGGIYELTVHLIRDHGYRKLAFIGGPPGNTDARLRQNAFTDALRDCGLEFDPGQIEYGDFTECVHEQVNTLLDRFPDLEALVCANDMMAVTACQECERRGLRIGTDIAVTGYDDWERIRYLPVPLTTVQQDSEEMGYFAVQNALELYQGHSGNKHIIPVKVRVRESCGCRCKQFGGVDEAERMSRKYVSISESYMQYRQKTWMVPMISRSMLMHLDDRQAFYQNAFRSMPFFGIERAMLLVYEEPIQYEKNRGWMLPEKLYMAASQEKGQITVYGERECPVNESRFRFSNPVEYQDRSRLSVFCLQSGTVQYGILAAEIAPEAVDIVYLISIQMANALMIYDSERRKQAIQRDRELLLEELRSKNEVLNFISEYDSMTGTRNRRGFMEAAMRLNRSNSGNSAVILIVDMDYLKRINDEYGHAAGDIAICACADILREAAGEGGITGRLGGDEFAVMMPGAEEKAAEVISEIGRLTEAYNADSGNTFLVSMSIGYQVVECAEGLPLSDVLKNADTVMYREKKRRGKSR